mmetsp:Transcript_25506/g.46109  ORF Transcript_25506/g.46109 Transcript_25506/m.46109 type:complete len:100 (-) Transcript_25506:69-368(-)
MRCLLTLQALAEASSRPLVQGSPPGDSGGGVLHSVPCATCNPNVLVCTIWLGDPSTTTKKYFLSLALFNTNIGPLGQCSRRWLGAAAPTPKSRSGAWNP